MLKKLYYQYFKTKFFNKIIITYTSIIVIILLTISLVVTNNIGKILYDNEVNANIQVVNNIGDYFERNYETLLKSLYSMYLYQGYINQVKPSDIFSFWENPVARDSSQYHELKTAFDNYILSTLSQCSDISSIVIHKCADKSIYVYHLYPNNRNITLDEDEFPYMKNIYALENNSASNTFVLPSFMPDYFKINEHAPYSVFCKIKSLDEYNKVIGSMTINFSSQGISNYLLKYESSVERQIVIYMDNGSVLFDSANLYYGKKYPYSNQISKTSHLTNTYSKGNIVNTYTVAKANVTIAGIVPLIKAMNNIDTSKHSIFILISMCLFVSILLIYFTTRMFSKRVKNITDVMKEVRKGDLSIRINTRATDEISVIARSFNKMCDNLKEYIETVYISNIKQKSAQLTALQSQINPHFLYNTLEAIRMKAVTNGDNDVGNMIFILAKLFRSSIKEDQIITIADEIKYSKLYLELFMIRYENRLIVDFEIPDPILEYGICKHLVQPIIENYVVHGFDPGSNSNRILIKANMLEGYINIIVEDNGKGITVDRMEQIRNSFIVCDPVDSYSIGLANVNERIKLIYGGDCGVAISSTEGKGTTVSLKILAKTKKELKVHVQGIAGR